MPGTDPVTGKWNYLTESTTRREAAAEALRRVTAVVDAPRVASTKATFAKAVDA